MSILQKAMNSLRMIRHGSGASWGMTMMKRTRYDYKREVGDGLDASVVTAPIQWIQRALPEARLTVQIRKADGDIEEELDHELLKLIANPNPFYGDIALWSGTIFSYLTDGNAYWYKARNASGKPMQLWYIPHWMLEPEYAAGGGSFIDYYRYNPGNGVEPMRIDPADIVHFRHGINPHDIRKGISPIGGAVREIFMDLESSNFVASLLRNMGVPGVVISPKNGAVVSSEDTAATKAWFQEAFGGDKRGGPLVMGAPTDVSPYGFNPQQMNMGEARDVAEERVCACLGVPAAVVGFGAGLQSTKVGATMAEMRKLAWHNGVLPVGRSFVDTIKRSLLPDFEKRPGVEVLWDTGDVLALQEEEDKLIDRKLREFEKGAITLFTYLTETGRDADDSHRFYMRPIASIEVHESEGMRPEPEVPAPKLLKHGADDGHSHGSRRRGVRASRAAYKRGTAFVNILLRQERGLQDSFHKPLKRLFEDFGKAAKKAALPVLDAQLPKTAKGDGTEQKSDELIAAEILERLGIAAWQGKLRSRYEAHYLTVAKSVSEAADIAGLGASLPDPVARSIVAAGGRRAGIVDMERQTRKAIFEALAEGRAEGEGASALAERIAGQVEGGHWQSPETRARIIARTETKYAQNISTIERARGGGVEMFVVFDGRLGEGRSNPSHIERDGSIVTAAEAASMAEAEHPNGTLSFAPHFDDVS